MEELWKNITLATPPSTHPHPNTTTTAYRTPLYGFLGSPKYTSTQCSDDHMTCSKKNPSLKPQGFSNCPCSNYFTSLCLKTRDTNDCNDTSRYKRKMENRESATRSRARRQAYTTELEIEVAKLREENAMLRKQNEEMSSAVATLTQLPKKTTLSRSFTAPF